ncbi:GFA family protein [Ruegeria atlantica]|uniref:GFA family protein n=1 Tax=Ruegeria atlantica TaxID=81569 RepID=UPI00147EAD5F|nr:GFA family protein [Ruegeria atlantica]
MPVAEGGCLCGLVRYAVQDNPVRVTACHCRFCQRATGSAYHVAPVFTEENFSVTQGEPKIYTHISDGSGKALYIRFCPECGTKLYLSLERFPGTVGVYGGTFDEPNFFASRYPISKQIFLASGRHGTIVPEGVESFWGHAIDADDRLIESICFSQPTTLVTDSDGRATARSNPRNAGTRGTSSG